MRVPQLEDASRLSALSSDSLVSDLGISENRRP